MPSDSCKVEEYYCASPSGEVTDVTKDEPTNNEPVKPESGKDGKWAIMQSMIKQVRNGTPIYRVHLPIFLQEPRSMLERYADFCSHMDIFTRYDPTTNTTQHNQYISLTLQSQHAGTKTLYFTSISPILIHI